MNKSTSLPRHRCETRQPAAPLRIAWHSGDGATTNHAGWVRDIAVSSVGFVTLTRDHPQYGDAIELTFNAAGRVPTRPI